jgi:hypothetical protein
MRSMERDLSFVGKRCQCEGAWNPSDKALAQAFALAIVLSKQGGSEVAVQDPARNKLRRGVPETGRNVRKPARQGK